MSLTKDDAWGVSIRDIDAFGDANEVDVVGQGNSCHLRRRLRRSGELRFEVRPAILSRYMERLQNLGIWKLSDYVSRGEFLDGRVIELEARAKDGRRFIKTELVNPDGDAPTHTRRVVEELDRILACSSIHLRFSFTTGLF